MFVRQAASSVAKLVTKPITTTSRPCSTFAKRNTASPFTHHISKLSTPPKFHPLPPVSTRTSSSYSYTTAKLPLSKPITVTTLQQLSRTTPLPHQPLQSSLLLSTLVGSICGVTTYYLYDLFWNGRDKPQVKQLTFNDIEKLINEPLPETFSNDVTLDGRMHKFHFKEYSLEDYEVVLSLPEEQMPLIEKINALRQLLFKHIENTVPLYKLLESRLDHLNASVLERIYLTYAFQAKLMHKALGREVNQTDVSMRSQRESIPQIINFEHLSQLKTLLVMLKDKVEHDFPTYEQSTYLNEPELTQAYNDLARLALESAPKLAYFKFLVLQHDLENTVQDPLLRTRLDTEVSQAHNTHGNAFTDAIDTLPAIDIRRRISVYRNKALDINSQILSDIEFLVDAIPAINDMMRASARSTVYRAEQAKLDDELRYFREHNGLAEDGTALPNPTTELDRERLDTLAQQAFEETELKYEHIAEIHNTFHDMWIRLTLCDDSRIAMVPDEEVTDLYDSMRSTYLDAKSKEFLPKFFFGQYNLQRPLQYNDLLNKAYTLLPENELDAPVAKHLLALYSQQDALQRDAEANGI